MHIRPATRKDLPDIATLNRDVQIDDEISKMISPYRYQHPECMRQSFMLRFTPHLYDGHSCLVAVSDDNDEWWTGTEQILGFASADSTQRHMCASNRPKLSFNYLELGLLRLREFFAWYTFADKSIDRAAYLKFRRIMSGPSPLDKINPRWELQYLAVAPAHQRQGIGKGLLRAVQELARYDELPIGLVASYMGYEMYKSMGFEDVGLIDIVPGRPHQAMVWYPAPNMIKSQAGTYPRQGFHDLN
jgi:GNAT superfamily N-acetyltransferase